MKVMYSVGFPKDHSATFSTFYASNVEYYLDVNQQRAFYANVLALPTDSTSVMLRFITEREARCRGGIPASETPRSCRQ